jgi:hypothetical protein
MVHAVSAILILDSPSLDSSQAVYIRIIRTGENLCSHSSNIALTGPSEFLMQISGIT